MKQGYSRARVAEALGISAGTIEGWEIGRVAKPPLHDVLRLARFLSVPLDDLERAALADDGGSDQPERGNAPSAASRVPGTAPLLEEAMRVLVWSEDDAADALQTTPEQIRTWRRRRTPMPLADVLALTALLGARLRDDVRGESAGRAG
jgi:transcriptional regulator with XRE-family HTH domain